MEEYSQLEKIFYKDREGYENEYMKRIHSYGTYLTDIEIKSLNSEGMLSSSEVYKLFIVNYRKLDLLQEKIKSKGYRIRQKIDKFSTIMKDNLAENIIIKDIKKSNDIEGVRSTKKEITEAYLNNSNVNLRFNGTVRLYMEVYRGKSRKNIRSLKDIREIYNQIMKGELDHNDYPDGKYFRKEPVTIQNSTGTKVIHRGISGEKNIEKEMEKFIELIENENIPFLIRSIIGHYFFEYIHPFYDGNGRLGRYIMCNNLSDELGTYMAMSISNIISKNKQKYYESFITVSKRKNKGEATFFVENILEMIYEGQKELELRVEKIEYRLKLSLIYINKLGEKLDKDEIRVLFILIQERIFKYKKEGTQDRKIFDFLKISRFIGNQIFSSLEKKNYVKKINKRPVTHILNEDCYREILNEDD